MGRRGTPDRCLPVAPETSVRSHPKEHSTHDRYTTAGGLSDANGDARRKSDGRAVDRSSALWMRSTLSPDARAAPSEVGCALRGEG